MNRLISLVVLVAGFLIQPLPAQTTAPTITPDAQKLLDQVTLAYGKLQSLILTGAVVGDFEVGGIKDHYQLGFTGKWLAPNSYQQNAPEDVIVGRNAGQTYAYESKSRLYQTGELPSDKANDRGVAPGHGELLLQQNPSLLFAATQSAGEILSRAYPIIRTGSGLELTGVKCSVLELENDTSVTRLLIDDSTHLIRQMQTDFTKTIAKRGVKNVKSALVSVRYDTIDSTTVLKPEAFAWVPPAGARDASQAAPEEVGPIPAMSLIGQPAPAFKLSTLDGKEIDLGQLKGKVVVLDFWATWCRPCVLALPGLQKTADEVEPTGVVVLTINREEEKEKITQFIEKRKLKLPVLLDPLGTTAKDYKVNGIPQTVVIDSQGIVRDVWSGFSPMTTEKKLKDAIESARKSR